MSTILVINILLLLIVICTLLIFSVRNTVWVLFFLIVIFIAVFFIFLLIGAEYAAYMILIIYIGAIMVLFLFVIMLLDIRKLEILKRIIKLWSFYLGFVLMLSVSILYDFIDIARRGGIQLASMYIDKMSLFTMLGEPNEVIFAAGLFTTLNPIYVFLIIYLVVALFLIFYMVKQGYGVYSWERERVRVKSKLKRDWKDFRRDIQVIINKFKKGSKK